MDRGFGEGRGFLFVREELSTNCYSAGGNCQKVGVAIYELGGFCVFFKENI